MTSRARMLLAERGLPSSNTAGYELFDQVGSLGLTSFMQEVTRVRALEGEIARTIQSINGISAARVHIVMAGSRQFPARRPEAFGIGHGPRWQQHRRPDRRFDPAPGCVFGPGPDH
jgi:flagellar biosynthesis/type III secretory pathway M-ring protein FliF/YscJ